MWASALQHLAGSAGGRGRRRGQRAGPVGGAGGSRPGQATGRASGSLGASAPGWCPVQPFPGPRSRSRRCQSWVSPCSLSAPPSLGLGRHICCVLSGVLEVAPQKNTGPLKEGSRAERPERQPRVASSRQASNIDDVLGHHASFLDNCLKDCMLTNPELLRVFSKLMSVCVMFTNCLQVRRPQPRGNVPRPPPGPSPGLRGPVPRLPPGPGTRGAGQPG